MIPRIVLNRRFASAIAITAPAARRRILHPIRSLSTQGARTGGQKHAPPPPHPIRSPITPASNDEVARLAAKPLPTLTLQDLVWYFAILPGATVPYS